MIYHSKDTFRKVKGIVAETVVDSSAAEYAIATAAGYGENFACTIECSSGILYVNPSTVATSANGYKLTEEESINIVVPSALSVIGDTSNAAYQAIIWD